MFLLVRNDRSSAPEGTYRFAAAFPDESGSASIDAPAYGIEQHLRSRALS
jgi:hypothetical protein